MSLSRMQTYQRRKSSRSTKNRRRFATSLVIAGVVLVGAGVYLSIGHSDILSLFHRDAKSATGLASENPGNSGQEEKNGIAGDREERNATEEQTDAGNETEEAQEQEAGANEGTGNDQEGTAGTPLTDEDLVALSFTGDLLPDEYIGDLLKTQGYDYPYRDILLYLSEPDVLAGNLETPITLRGTPMEHENLEYVYRGSPDVLPAMASAGFDVFSLANNHAMDQGVEGMLDTKAYLDEAGIGNFGTGSNDVEAFAPLVKEVRGMKVAYIGVSRVIPFAELKADRNVPGIAETYDTTRAVKAIQKAEEEADIVVVMVHWGKNNEEELEPYQSRFAKEYIDAGADLVIGSHPHVLQGFEKYKNRWIAYSLGNFIFSKNPEGKFGETGVLDAHCNKLGECELTFHPMRVVDAQPVPMEEEEAAVLLDRLSSISYGVRVSADGRLTAEK
ncbi:CapA family protein [Paenibacillus sp. J5C_2022]|uniref:CapA family protein n=1 Tax=Paenibacillus sp. J5C2022 TaxID=2977129 RepID=UPI0021CDED65|nr:CapA family protein [Paenibacillus sp. J5C2022]MCU6707593.1 CapA family protein [Paenibacillus sp. J5C2022]